MKTNYTREELLKICEKSFVQHNKWSDRDTASSQQKLGECYALLKDGCNFEILTNGDLKTDERTIWVEIWFIDFSGFENGCHNNASETYYLPTPDRLKQSKGRDWY